MRRILAFLSGAATVLVAASAQAQQPQPWQINLQEPATPFAQAGFDFNNLLMVIIIGISVFVMVLLAVVIFRFNAKSNPVPSKTTHNTLIEVMWTVVPVLILVVIAVPSFRLLYLGDRVEDPEMTLQVHGYQWYWGYEYPDQQIEEYASYMIPDEEIDPEAGQLRLLSVDNPVVLPVDTDIQILVTGADVLHSFALPSFMIKTDAITGRWNESWARIEREGVYYGQCSEICGTGHGYMPIELHAVSREAFDQWTIEQVGDAEIDPENPPALLTTTWAAAMAERDAQLRLASAE